MLCLNIHVCIYNIYADSGETVWMQMLALLFIVSLYIKSSRTDKEDPDQTAWNHWLTRIAACRKTGGSVTVCRGAIGRENIMYVPILNLTIYLLHNDHNNGIHVFILLCKVIY